MPDYIRWLRDRVGPDPILLNFAAACVVRDGAVLLQRRSDDGAWCLPGGALELGESAEEAVLRELVEETGLRVRVDGLLGVYSKYRHVYPNGDVTQPVTTMFRCSPLPGAEVTMGVETLDLGWFPVTDVPPLMNSQHEDAVADLRAGRVGVYR